jgi:hypothetical protein
VSIRDPIEAGGRRRFGAWGWLRVAVSLGLVVWIAREVDWVEFARTLRGTDLGYLTLSLAISPLLILISAWKWQLLLRARSSDPGLKACFHLYMVGYLYNHVLPTTVGGDVVRAFVLGKQTGRPATALASVFLERFTGLTALIAVALVAYPFELQALHRGPVVAAMAVVVLGYLVLLWAILDVRLLRLTQAWVRLPVVRKLTKLHEAIDSYRGKRRVLLACMALSALFYVGAALNVLVTARAFRADLGPMPALLATPVILIVSMFPVSIGGLGLSEGAYVLALGAYGVSPAAGLSTALMMRLKGMLTGLAGGYSAAFGPWETLREIRAAAGSKGAD